MNQRSALYSSVRPYLYCTMKSEIHISIMCCEFLLQLRFIQEQVSLFGKIDDRIVIYSILGLLTHGTAFLTPHCLTR